MLCRVRYITSHGVRRTCASLLAALDVHPRVAMRILRYSKIAVTMEIYTEVPDQAARNVLRRLGEQFDCLGTAALCCCTKTCNDADRSRRGSLTWARSEGLEPQPSDP
jgi:hypothetical protein